MDYHAISEELQAIIRRDREDGTVPAVGCPDDAVVRRHPGHDVQNLWRPVFVRDAEKILNCPYYNRYADKTQVFSFYKNDDITRRALHVQLVSRIARNIGRMLGLNLDLIEAIALGHDMGHTPFGHAGESFLNRLYHAHTGRFFCHNVHSVRVLDSIFPFNISLQTLDGVLCHNGEFELQEYRPSVLSSFAAFDAKLEECYTDPGAVPRLIPSTLEGCVVRVSDIIAYLGKDRQDAQKAGLIASDSFEANQTIGQFNAQMINNLTVNIVENSYGKPYIKLDPDYYGELKRCKQENYDSIYTNPAVRRTYDEVIGPMFDEVYGALLDDLKRKNTRSVIYRHHIRYVEDRRQFYQSGTPYADSEPNQLVVDYIASMTDDYFLDLHAHLFPDSPLKVAYISYFDDEK